MNTRNPYFISFGRIPTQYISRALIVDSIVETLESDIIEEQAFKLTGIRGMGKTVTLTAIEKKIKENDNWIVIDLKTTESITQDLLAELYSKVPFVTEFVDKEMNLSKFGIGISVSKKSPVASIDYALKELLKIIKKKNKRVLIAIDEVRRTDSLVDFIQEFQILIREEMPIYIVVAGLYEDIESIENTDGLTFFLRATKYEMTPLNYTSMRCDYEKTLGVSREVAEEMATITKGYPFAYQALGKYMWDEKAKEVTDIVLAYLDEALAEKVYNKIWSELKAGDKLFLKYITEKDKIEVSELLTLAGKKHNEWSEPRKRLKEKGIIDVSVRGMIKMRLPRLKEYIESIDNY